MNVRVALRLFVIVVSIFTLTGVVGAAAPANQIVVHSQDIHQNIVMVDSVTAEQAGWIVIYKRGDLASDMIVGYAKVEKGLNPNVRVTIDTTRTSDVKTLWAALHIDRAPLGVFEWGTNGRAHNDLPVAGVVVAFGTQGDSAPLALTAAMTIKNQETLLGKITIDSITTPVDGWVAVYKGPVFTSASIVGYAPIYQGLNSNVPVAVDVSRIEKDPTLWAILLTDQGTHGIFEYGRWGRAKADVPLIQNGAPVVVAFGTH